MNGKEYQTLKTEIKTKCMQAKEEWLGENREDEQHEYSKYAPQNERIKRTKGGTAKMLDNIKGRITDNRKNTPKVERLRQRTF